MFIEKYKDDVMAEEFRQLLLRRTSAEEINFDESKRPTYTPVNESFRRLAVDWYWLTILLCCTFE